jgi:hypothetical protein
MLSLLYLEPDHVFNFAGAGRVRRIASGYHNVAKEVLAGSVRLPTVMQ